MTIRTACRSFPFPLMFVQQSGYGVGAWQHLASIRPSAILGNADHVAIVHGLLGRSSHTNPNSKLEIEVRIVWHSAGPNVGPWKTHHMVLGNDLWSPGNMAGFPFHMVQRMGDGNQEPLDVYARVIHHQHTATGAPGLSVGMIENLTLTFFDLQTFDDESIPWNYVEGTSTVQFGSSGSGAVLTGAGLPLVSPDDDGTDYWPLFWDVGVVPREPGQPVDVGPAPAYVATFYPFATNQWRCIPTVTQSGGTPRTQWIGHGFGSRQTPTLSRDLFRIGGSYLHNFAAGQGTDYFEVRGIEDTNHGEAVAPTVPQTTTQTASIDYALFTFAAHKMNLVSSTRSSPSFHYGVPRQHEFEFPDAVADPIRAEWVGDQARPRVAFFNGVAQHTFSQTGIQSQVKTDIEYSFAGSAHLGTNDNPNKIYVHYDSELEHTPDNEVAELLEIVGQNSIQGRGEWNPDQAPVYRQVGGGDLSLARQSQIWTIEQKTGIAAYVPPNPQPGADVYLVPGFESLDADSLPELPTSPVDAVSYDLENKPTVLRTTDGETIAWPRYAKPESGASFRFVIDRGTAAGSAEHAALMSFLETSEGAAFQFTPHGEVDSRPYVADLRSLRETSRGKKVVEITMQAFELRFVGP